MIRVQCSIPRIVVPQVVITLGVLVKSDGIRSVVFREHRQLGTIVGYRLCLQLVDLVRHAETLIHWSSRIHLTPNLRVRSGVGSLLCEVREPVDGTPVHRGGLCVHHFRTQIQAVTVDTLSARVVAPGLAIRIQNKCTGHVSQKIQGCCIQTLAVIMIKCFLIESLVVAALAHVIGELLLGLCRFACSMGSTVGG